ncbi:MAG: hypothetical protein Aurels2KO_26380 [Aureliella sp.]
MEYEIALQSVAGLPLAKIGRSADLLWLQFGDLREVDTRYGAKTVGDWAIHIQTSWRFVSNAQITLAVGDLYLLPSGDSYDWDIGGDSNFDIIARDFNKLLSSTSLLVQNTKCDDVGGFSLSFSNGIRFDVFPKISDTIDDIEHWRMFAPNTDDKHTVCETKSRNENAG